MEGERLNWIESVTISRQAGVKRLGEVERTERNKHGKRLTRRPTTVAAARRPATPRRATWGSHGKQKAGRSWGGGPPNSSGRLGARRATLSGAPASSTAPSCTNRGPSGHFFLLLRCPGSPGRRLSARRRSRRAHRRSSGSADMSSRLPETPQAPPL